MTTGVIAAVLAVAVSGCASQPSALPARPAAAPQPATVRSASAAAPGQPSIDRLTAIARRRYAEEARGAAAQRELRRIASDPALRAVLGPGGEAGLRAYVRGEFQRVWYHEHVSRLRIVRGSRTVIDTGVPFVVAASTLALNDAHGRLAGTLQISMQDVIGFVRYMHRGYPVEVVVRGSTAAHVRTSLPAANPTSLPDRGATTIAGRRYSVRSFHETGLDHEPLKVWILARRVAKCVC